MSKEIYTCDACHYTFEAETGCDQCPDCGKKIYLFGEGKSEEAAKRHNLPLLAQMPIDPKLAALVDAGKIEEFEGTWLNAAADALEKTRKRAE